MKKLSYLIVLTLILGLVLTGCSLLSNISQVPATPQSGISYLTKNGSLPNLVGLWHFDEGSGTTASDSSEYSNNGTLMGGTIWTSGMFGQALSFDNDSDYVDCGDDASFDFEDKFTVEAWINLNVIPGYYDIIVNRAYGNWMFAVHAGKLEFGEYLWYPGSGTRRIYSDVVSWNAGQWYHVAVVYDTIGKTADFYLDGVSIGTGRQSSDPFGIVNSGNVGISGPYGQTSFNGIIDEVRIWDGALTADQLIIYDDYSGLLAPYKGPDKAFKSGSSIPLKWQYKVSDTVVNSSTANPSVKIKQVVANGDPIDGTLIVVNDPGSSGYHYDSETNTWHFNWQTESNGAGDYEIYIINDWTGQTFGPCLIKLR